MITQQQEDRLENVTENFDPANPQHQAMLRRTQLNALTNEDDWANGHPRPASGLASMSRIDVISLTQKLDLDSISRRMSGRTQHNRPDVKGHIELSNLDPSMARLFLELADRLGLDTDAAFEDAVTAWHDVLVDGGRVEPILGGRGHA